MKSGQGANELWRADRVDVRLRQGRLDARQLRALAEALAERLKASSHEPDLEHEASCEALARRARAEVARLRSAAAVAGVAPEPHPERVLAWQHRFVQAEADRLKERAVSAPKCGGSTAVDLVRAHVDAELRVSLATPPLGAATPAEDAAAEVARLAAALCAAGRPDLADRFVAAYAEASHDFPVYPVLPLYESLAATRLAAEAFAAGDAVGARRALAAALPSSQPSRARLVAVGGVLASGKSTVAAALGERIGAPVISADRVRAALVARARGEVDASAPGFAFAVHREITRYAEAVLDAGRSVVLDGCFHTRAMRRAARCLARQRGLPFLFLECRADERTLEQRLASRVQPEPIPGGWRARYEASLREWEPVEELAADEHRSIDTSRPAPRGLDRIARARRPPASQLVA